MAKELKGSKTEQNLWEAFAGESQARNKYTYYASKAKKDGYEQMAQLFQETADQEKEHAKMWFKLIHGIGTTADNLKDAAQGENDEWTDMYPRMAREAREEGFEEIAKATFYFNITITDGSTGAELSSIDYKIPTGIETIEADADGQSTDDAWYTIGGARLTGKPTAPGIYIQGKKKILVK